MPVKSYSLTAGSNTETFFENMQPSAVNNGVRAIQADLAAFYREAGWREVGTGDGAGDGTTDYTAAFASSTSVTFAGVDVTTAYHKGRPVRANVDAGSYIYGIVASSTFSTNSTVTFQWFSGSLSSGTIRLWLGEHTATNPSLAVANVKEIAQTVAISSGVAAIDPLLGSYVQITLNANITSISVTWPAGVSSWNLQFTQDGTGSRTVAFPAGWKWSDGTEGAITADAAAIDIFTVWSPDGGTTVFAAQAGTAFS
jgi:hypothetical protein